MSIGTRAENFNVLINDMQKCDFSVWDRKYSLVNALWQIWSNKSKIVSLSWNMVLWLIRIPIMQWHASFFSVFDRKYPFWESLTKKSKLSISAEIWCLDWFKYAVFNGGVYFFWFRPGILFLGKFGSTNPKLSV